MYPSLPPVMVFPLGRIVATASALACITQFEMAAGLARHARGDWGDIRKKQRRINDRALRNSSRLSSSYLTKTRRRFHVVTEADRSETTVLLPEDIGGSVRPTNSVSEIQMNPSVTASFFQPPNIGDESPEQLDLFEHSLKISARQSQGRLPQEWKVVSVRECPAPESLMLLDGPGKAVEYWHECIAFSPGFNPEVECVAVLMLSTRLRIKGHYLVSVGSLNETLAHPREVYRLAVLAAAHSIVLLHNHPSGDSSPSSADASMTRRIRESGSILQIELCDHIIVGHRRYFSFKESGML